MFHMILSAFGDPISCDSHMFSDFNVFFLLIIHITADKLRYSLHIGLFHCDLLTFYLVVNYTLFLCVFLAWLRCCKLRSSQFFRVLYCTWVCISPCKLQLYILYATSFCVLYMLLGTQLKGMLGRKAGRPTNQCSRLTSQ